MRSIALTMTAVLLSLSAHATERLHVQVHANAESARSRIILQRDNEGIVLRDSAGALVARGEVAETSEMIIEGSDGDDTLLIDFSRGNPIPPGGLTFHGGAQVTAQGDAIEIEGGSFGRAVYDYTNAHDGAVTVDGAVIRYTGLEPLSNSGTVTDVVFNLPSGTTNAQLQDDGVNANGMVQLFSSNGAFETTNFTVPSNSLTVNAGAGGTATISTISNLNDLTVSLTINGANATDTVNVGALFLTAPGGALSVNANNIILSGTNFHTAGGQTYAGNVTLTAITALVSTGGGNVAFNGPVDGAFTLSVNTAGSTTYEGPIGGTTPPVGVFTNTVGTTNINGGSVTTTAAQSYFNPVTLGANTTLAGGNISFNSTLNGAFALVVNSSLLTTFGGAVGGTSALTSITTNAGGSTHINGGSVATTGAQAYNDIVVIGANVSLTSSAAGNISFASSLNGSFNVALNTAGTTSFGGNVGGSPALASLVTDAGGSTAINAGNVVTQGVQTYNDALTLGSNVLVISQASGNVTFNGTIDGTFALNINTGGATTFGGAIGGSTPLLSLSTNAAGSTNINNSITTNGAQAYNDPVTLGANVTVTAAAVTFFGTLNGASSLIVNANSTKTFNGVIGGTTPLTSLTTNAAGLTTINGGAVNTSGAQAFNDFVTLGTGTVFTSSGGGSISFGGSLTGSVAVTINTAGTTTFGGVVGSPSVLASINTDAGGSMVVSGGSVSTSGAQAYSDAVTLGANATFTSTAGTITFNSTVNGAFSLSVNTPMATTFVAAVGGITPPTSISTNAAGLTQLGGGAITTTGAQTYSDPVILLAGCALTSTGAGIITHGGTVNGAFALAVNTAGGTTFGGAVGGVTPLASVLTDAAGSLAMNGGSFITTGAQTFNDAALLGTNTTFSSPSTINVAGAVSGAFGITKAGAGTMTLAAANTYTGGTTVNAGTLLVNNSTGSGTGSGILTVAAGATLGGTGTIAGTADLQPNAILAPGNSVGTLSIAGGATWNGSVSPTATALFELSNVDATSDRLAIAGALAKGTGTTFLFDLLGTGQPGTYTLATFASTTFVIGDFSFTNLAPGLTAAFSFAGNSLQLTVAAPGATHFAVSAPASATAGSAFSFTVTALDALNSIDTTYTGTAHFTSSDGSAVLPSDATLTNGAGTFSATLQTAGTQTIVATDTVTPSITGTSNNINVSAAAATHFAVSAPGSGTAGAAFTFDVSALDSSNNTDTAYSGTVHFTATDVLATVPADVTLTNGVGTFSATLRTSGSQTIIATDTVTPSITGTSNSIDVSAAAATHFAVSAPASAIAGSAFSFTVTALDAFDNTAPSYSGTVHFTSDDGSATIPADSTLTGGVGTFSATLRTSGSRTITATDTITPSITGTSGSINVSAAAATHFAVSAPGSATAGGAFTFTVTALDSFDNTDTAYGGTVHFTSTDALATLPADVTLTNGVGTFSATLHTAGSQAITATDTVTPSITGTSNSINVDAAAATHFIVNASPSAFIGVSTSFTVTAADAFNNVATTYSGTVHFTSTDGAALLPADSTLVNGQMLFSATMNTAGIRTVTATDTVAPSITGTSNNITVSAGPANQFAVSAPGSVTTGVPFTFTVTAFDALSNLDTAYSGTVHFTSTDGAAALPADATLVNGVGTFSATLNTVSTHTITATDTVNASLFGVSNAIDVLTATPTNFNVTAPASTTAGAIFNFTVTAVGPGNITVTGYSGTIHFTSTDSAATLPANATLTNGVGTFSATLRTAGNRALVASDASTPSITGSANITVDAGDANHFIVSTPASTVTGTPFSFTVVARDAFDNDATSYTGTVQFTSSGDATLPADSTLTNGTGTFSATLNTPGSQSITATDSVTASITGTSDIINAAATTASIPVLSPLALLLLAAMLAMMGVIGSRAMS